MNNWADCGTRDSWDTPTALGESSAVANGQRSVGDGSGVAGNLGDATADTHRRWM
jgi:hypothetical protein